MATYYASETDRDAVIGWIRAGATKEEYETVVSPILKKSCVMCHSKDGPEANSPLTSFDEVMKYVEISTGVPPLALHPFLIPTSSLTV